MDTTHFLIDIKTMAPDRNGVIYEISAAAFAVREEIANPPEAVHSGIQTIILRVDIDEQLSYSSDVVFNSYVMLDLCENNQFSPQLAKTLHITGIELMKFIKQYRTENSVFWYVTDGQNSCFDAYWRFDYSGLDEILASAVPMNILYKLFPNKLRAPMISKEMWVFPRAVWLKNALIELQLREPVPMHTEQEKMEAARKLMEGVTEHAIGTLKDSFEKVLNSYGFKYPVNPNNE